MEVLAACPLTACCGRCTLDCAACPSKRAAASGRREINYTRCVPSISTAPDQTSRAADVLPCARSRAPGNPRTQARAGRELLERALHDIRILDRQLLVIEQHLDRRGQLRRTPLVHRIEHPVVSASTSCDTQAPPAMNASAAATCAASSRTSKRTSRLVSTARMALAHVLANARLDVDRLALGGFGIAKQRRVDVFGRALAGAPHDELSVAPLPDQHRPGPRPAAAAPRPAPRSAPAP